LVLAVLILLSGSCRAHSSLRITPVTLVAAQVIDGQ